MNIELIVIALLIALVGVLLVAILRQQRRRPNHHTLPIAYGEPRDRGKR